MRSLKKRLKKFIRQPGDPPKLAFAFAMGILLGVLPFTGAVVAAGLATVLRLNLPLAMAGAMVTNPLTAPLVYGGSFFLGRWLLGNAELEQTITRILLTTIAGNLTLAMGMALTGYLLVWGFAAWCQSKKRPHASRH